MKDKTVMKWEAMIAEKLQGRTITKVEYLGKTEAQDMGWHYMPIALVLDDGNWLVPMADDEGNDGGAMATSYKEFHTIPVMR
jgi:hypothetical protein